MGLLDTVAKVLIQFKADPSELRAAMKNMTEDEKKLAQVQLDSMNARNKGIDDWKAKLADVNQVLELVGKSVGFAKDAFASYANDMRLRSAAGAIDLDRMKTASLGLRTEQELLAFAAKAHNGVIKASQADMETAEKAMIALTRAGFDQEEVTNKITKAMTTAKTEGLEELGLSLTAGKTPLETYTKLMAALSEKAKGVKDGQRTAAEGVEQVGVTMADATDKMKQSIGGLVAAMKPLLDALAAAVDLIAKIAASHGVPTPEGVQAYIEGQIKSNPGGNAAFAYNLAHGIDPNAPKKRAVLNAGHGDASGILDALDALQPKIDSFTKTYLVSQLDSALDSLNPKNAAKKGGNYFGGGTVAGYASVTGGDRVGPLIGYGSTRYNSLVQGFGISSPSGLLQNGVGGDFGIGDAKVTGDWTDTGKLADDQLKDFYDRQSQLEKGMLIAAQRQKQQSFLETSFGKLGDFTAYSEAFGMLTGSVTAGLNAWIDGSESAGTAIKKFIGQALKGLASQMAVESLKHGAYALGSLAFGDFAGAAMHGAAAAAFGTGAAAAAVAAKEMGGDPHDHRGAGSGGSAGGGRSGGGAVSSPGSGDHNGGKGGRDVLIIYADAFADSSESQRRQQAKKLLSRVSGGQAYSNS